MREIRGIIAFTAFVCSLLLLSLIGNIVQSKKIEKLTMEPPATAIDRPYIAKAVDLWSAKVRYSGKRLMDGRFAKAMYIGNEVCVSLEIDIGGVGGTPVYCFRKADGTLSRKYDAVQ